MKIVGVIAAIVALALVCDAGAQCVVHSRTPVHVAPYVAPYVPPIVVTPIATAVQLVPVPFVVPVYQVGLQAIVGPGFVPQPVQGVQSVQQPVPQPNPQPVPAQAQSQVSSFSEVIVKNCSSCHDRAAATGKGRGIVLTDGNALAALSSELKLKVIHAVHENLMPPAPLPKLSDKDYSEIVVGMSGK